MSKKPVYFIIFRSTTANMVHLAEIKHEDAPNGTYVDKQLKKVHLHLANDADQFTTSVYGSRFAMSDLPRHEMPEHEMPKEVRRPDYGTLPCGSAT